MISRTKVRINDFFNESETECLGFAWLDCALSKLQLKSGNIRTLSLRIDGTEACVNRCQSNIDRKDNAVPSRAFPIIAPETALVMTLNAFVVA